MHPTIERFGVCAIAFLAFAVFLWAHLDNLGRLDFRNDEFQAVATGFSHHRTGEYTRWDFHRNATGRSYERGKPYTWQLGRVYDRFGVSEVSSRLVSVAWSVLLVPLLTWILLRERIATPTAMAILILVAFDNYLVFFGRYARFYSMLVTLYFALSYAVYRATVGGVLRGVLLGPVEGSPRPLAWSIGAVALAALAYPVHRTALVIAPALVAFFWFAAVAVRGAPGFRLLRIAALTSFTLVGCAVAGGTLLGGEVEPPRVQAAFGEAVLAQVSLRSRPLWEYGPLLGLWWRLPPLAWALAAAGCAAGLVRLRRAPFEAWLAANLLVILVFFVFFGKRYASLQYVAFARPFMSAMIVVGAVALGRAAGRRVRARSAPGWVAGALVAAVFLPSFPGVRGDGFWLQRSVADDDYTVASTEFEPFYPNYRKTLGAVRARARYGNRVLSTVPRTYYLATDLVPVRLAKLRCRIDEYERVMREHEPTWFVQPRLKASHLCPELWERVEMDFAMLEMLPETNVLWGINRSKLAPDELADLEAEVRRETGG